jgi:hypothetical protein
MKLRLVNQPHAKAKLILRRNGTVVAQDVRTRTVPLLLHRLPSALGLPVSVKTFKRLSGARFICAECRDGVAELGVDNLQSYLTAAARPGFWTPERVARWNDARNVTSWNA